MVAEKSMWVQNLNWKKQQQQLKIYLALTLFSVYLSSTYYVLRLPAVNRAEKSLKLPVFMFWEMLVVKVQHSGLDSQHSL